MAGMADFLAEDDAAVEEPAAAPAAPEDDMAAAKAVAAADLIDAFKTEDAEALAAAFQRMYDACSGASAEAEPYPELED